MLKNSQTHYGFLAKFFHWSIALLFGFQFLSILYFRYLEESPTDWTWTVLNAHKTAGVLILILGFARLIWRWQVPLPHWPSTFNDWDKAVSHFAEYGLYCCIFLMTLSGIMIEMAGGHYVPFFDLFYIDNLTPFIHLGAVSYADTLVAARTAAKMPGLHDFLVVIHIIGAYGVVVFLSIHITHIVYHQRHLKDGLLNRMLGQPKETDQSES